jgi:putative ABC transport system ATP-binding protein
MHPPSIPPRSSQQPPPGGAEALIQVEHLTRVIAGRATRTVIVDDVTFGVPARSLFAINGPSGSGKSTILHMLTGIDRPSSGRVLFAGQELRALGEDALARWRGRHVGIVFQFFQLIPTLTALENVLLALELGGGGGRPRRQWRERALTCLELAQIADLAHRLPSELSGGEQQRVAIARALANDPPVIVADEPTGNLDSRTAHQVFATLAGLTDHGKTVVYVTHARELAARASARIDLLDGRVVGRDHTRAILSGSCDGRDPDRAHGPAASAPAAIWPGVETGGER